MSDNVEKAAEAVEETVEAANKHGILKPAALVALLAGGVAMATQWNDLIAALAKPQIDAAVATATMQTTQVFADAMKAEQERFSKEHAARLSLIASVRTLPHSTRRQIPADILEWKP